MKRISALLLAGLLVNGCASLTPEPDASSQAKPVAASRAATTALEQADAKMAAADYRGAQALYAQFINENPDNAQTARARATQGALDRLLSSQAELDLLKRSEEVPRLRRELSEKQGEVDRLKAEIAKLRADMERLRNIDLKTLPGSRK
jgi:predicted RNase H-like nuclease (RuvC/YqgF family)